MFTYNIFIYQLEPETLIFKGFPALPIHLSVENRIVECKQYFKIVYIAWKVEAFSGQFSRRGVQIFFSR